METMYERKTTHNVVTGSVLLGWAAFLYQDRKWTFVAVWTMGTDINPHTKEAVRRDVEAAYGPVQRLAVLGPYWDRETVYRVHTLVQNDPAFWQSVKQSAV